MKRITFLTLCSIAILGSVSCTKEVINGSGPEITQERSAANFTAIDLLMNATVHYTEGTGVKVDIRAQQNVANEIITDVSNNRLIVRLPADTRLVSYSPINIYITAPAVSDFNLSSSGSIEATNMLHADNTDFNISGSGSITVAGVTTNDIDARVSGSGKVIISSGTSTTVETNISGSGNIDIVNVVAKNGIAFISGSGESKLNVSDELEAHISGSGKIYYKGNPVINSHISGSGKLVHL